MKRFLRIILPIFVMSLTTFSQWERLEKPDAADVSGPVPIVFGSPTDGFPERIKVHGIIKELTFAQADCGRVYWGGTLKIELSQKPKNYSDNNIFVMVGCFGHPEKFGRDKKKYLDKEIEFEAYKLYPQYQFGSIKDIKSVPCSFDIITNKINSKGIPFYCTRENISIGIKELEKLNNKH